MLIAASAGLTPKGQGLRSDCSAVTPKCIKASSLLVLRGFSLSNKAFQSCPLAARPVCPSVNSPRG